MVEVVQAKSKKPDYDFNNSDDRVMFYSGQQPYTSRCYEMDWNNAEDKRLYRRKIGMPEYSTSYHCGHGKQINGIRKCYWNGHLDGYCVCACIKMPSEAREFEQLHF